MPPVEDRIVSSTASEGGTEQGSNLARAGGRDGPRAATSSPPPSGSEEASLAGKQSRPTVTVVVPTRNSARTIEASLRSLRAQSLRCRVVVVDNASNDRTVALATQLADAVLTAGPERSAQRNAGARAFPAEIVGFIDSDMVLTPGVVEEAATQIAAGADAVVVPEVTVGSGYWVKVRAFERSLYVGNEDVEAARFFRWEAFDRAGGFDEHLTGPEDWDLSDAVRRSGTLARTTAMIEHDEGSIGYLEACRKKAYYAEGLKTFTRTRGVTTAFGHLSRRPWISSPALLIRNIYGPGLVLLKAGEAGAVVGALLRNRLRTGKPRQ